MFLQGIWCYLQDLGIKNLPFHQTNTLQFPYSQQIFVPTDMHNICIRRKMMNNAGEMSRWHVTHSYSCKTAMWIIFSQGIWKGSWSDAPLYGSMGSRLLSPLFAFLFQTRTAFTVPSLQKVAPNHKAGALNLAVQSQLPKSILKGHIAIRHRCT